MLSRRREQTNARAPFQPARAAVALASLYIVAMLGLQRYAEGIARRDLAGTGRARENLVVTASPANPLRWRVHADDGARYWIGNVGLGTRRLALSTATLDKGADHPAVASAILNEDARGFLDWARLPFYRVDQTPGGTLVRITDARYGASIVVPSTSPQ
jgi:inner membrane protein